MPDLVAGVLDKLAGLNTTVRYLLAGLFTGAGDLSRDRPAGPGRRRGPVGQRHGRHPHWSAALVAVTALGSLAGYLLGRRYGLRLRAGWLCRRLGEQRWAAAEAFLAGLAVVAAAFGVVPTVRAAGSRVQRLDGGAPLAAESAPWTLAVDPLGGGRNERHDTAA
jgi:hypothetical protein